jgi:CheY-like chemotaxis protein
MVSERFGRPIEILMAEDNPADVRLTREALKDGRVLNNLTIAEDGEVTMALLRKEGAYADAPTPDLILLDLNLPRKDGREVLAEIKSDEKLKRIPVVILTTSKAEEDILLTYDHHANCYITKPVDLENFLRVVRSVEDFWLSIVTLPTEPGH